MGCGIRHLQWLIESKHLKRNDRVLDIGESCLLATTAADLLAVWDRLGCRLNRQEQRELAAVFATRSNTIGDQEIPTLFLGEMLASTTVSYSAIDIVSARGAHRFDLNRHALAQPKQKSFDLILNFGTTEHLMNQYNCFKVIHDATKPHGLMFHQVPSSGYINHGYFTYDALMFQELAAANNYDVLEMWFAGPQGASNILNNRSRHPSIANPKLLDNNVAGFERSPVVNSLINVLLRKRADSEFRVGLEVQTAAGPLANDSAFSSEFVAA